MIVPYNPDDHGNRAPAGTVFLNFHRGELLFAITAGGINELYDKECESKPRVENQLLSFMMEMQ